MPAGEYVFAANSPAPPASSTETELELAFAVTRSGLPSALRSPIARAEASTPASNGKNGGVKRGLALAAGPIAVRAATAIAHGTIRAGRAEGASMDGSPI